MNKYTVNLTTTTTYAQSVEVEADNLHDALALAVASADEQNWEPVSGDEEIIEIDSFVPGEDNIEPGDEDEDEDEDYEPTADEDSEVLVSA